MIIMILSCLHPLPFQCLFFISSSRRQREGRFSMDLDKNGQQRWFAIPPFGFSVTKCHLITWHKIRVDPENLYNPGCTSPGREMIRPLKLRCCVLRFVFVYLYQTFALQNDTYSDYHILDQYLLLGWPLSLVNQWSVVLESAKTYPIWPALQATNVSHLWKRNIILKCVLGRDMLVPRSVFTFDKFTNCKAGWKLVLGQASSFLPLSLSFSGAESKIQPSLSR